MAQGYSGGALCFAPVLTEREQRCTWLCEHSTSRAGFSVGFLHCEEFTSLPFCRGEN